MLKTLNCIYVSSKAAICVQTVTEIRHTIPLISQEHTDNNQCHLRHNTDVYSSVSLGWYLKRHTLVWYEYYRPVIDW